MNLQESIKKILREEKKPSNYLLRRLDMLDYEVEKNFYGQAFLFDTNFVNVYSICIFFKSDIEYFETIMENSIDAMYYNYFSHIDDNSGEWAHEYLDMVNYIRKKYQYKIMKHYDDNCGSGSIPLKESIRKVLKEELNESENIKKVLSEELKDSLTDLIKTDGVERALKTVGGFKRLAKILELDLDDIDTQEMLVKNFIYHTKIDQIDVSFIEVRSSGSGGKILTVNLKTDDTASNVTSWYVHEICNYFNGRQDSSEVNKKLFPFKVKPAWHPVFGKEDGCKIFLNAEIVNDEEDEDLMESKQKGPREENKLPSFLRKRSLREESTIQIKLNNMINKFGIKMASTAVGGMSRLIKILDLDDKGLDELIYEHLKEELYLDFTNPWGPEEHVTHKYYEKQVNYYGMHTFQINGIEAYSYFGEFDGYNYLYLLSINRWMVNELTSMFGDKWIPIFKRWFEKNSGLEVKEINIEGKFLHEH